MIARSAPSPSSPAPSVRRYAALGLDRSARRAKPATEPPMRVLTMLHDYLTTSDRSNAGFLNEFAPRRYSQAGACDVLSSVVRVCGTRSSISRERLGTLESGDRGNDFDECECRNVLNRI